MSLKYDCARSSTRIDSSNRGLCVACSSFFHNYAVTTPTSYVQVESDMIGVTYMSCGVESVHKAINTCAENYSKSLRLSGPGTARASLILSFYERHKKKVAFQSEYYTLSTPVIASIVHFI